MEGTGPQRRPKKRVDWRLEEVAKAVGGGYCRLQTPLRLALAVRGTVAGRRLGALKGGGGGRGSPLSNASLAIEALSPCCGGAGSGAGGGGGGQGRIRMAIRPPPRGGGPSQPPPPPPARPLQTPPPPSGTSLGGGPPALYHIVRGPDPTRASFHNSAPLGRLGGPTPPPPPPLQTFGQNFLRPLGRSKNWFRQKNFFWAPLKLSTAGGGGGRDPPPL